MTRRIGLACNLTTQTRYLTDPVRQRVARLGEFVVETFDEPSSWAAWRLTWVRTNT